MSFFPSQPPASGRRAAGFSLIEVLVVITLLAIIVLSLMEVFNSTQRAFRAGVTQTDVLESSRAAVELISSDLRGMAAAAGVSNSITLGTKIVYGGINFAASDNNSNAATRASCSYWPLVQSLPPESLPPGSGAQRTNVLNYFFVLGRQNTKWTGAGYVVGATNTASLYPLYRFYAETNISANPIGLYWNFLNEVASGHWTNMSHLLDGVVHLTVRTFDNRGFWLTNGYSLYQTNRPQNVYFSAPAWGGEVGFAFYSNTLPAAVEFELGVIEDRALQRAESLPNTLPAPPPNDRRTLYLQGLSGDVHLFRQRVTIPNVDASVYQ